VSDFEFFTFAPSPALAPFIECVWGVRGSTTFTQEAILPNGAIELMVNFGPTQKVHAYGERTVDESFRRYWLAGIQDQPLVIGSPHGTDHLGVRFRPGGAHAFFDVPMDAVSNQVLDLDLVLSPGPCEELRERLEAIPGDLARAREVERWLGERRYAVHPYFATVRRALDLLQASGFGIDVGELCDRVGLSNRQLIAQFRTVVGLTPKTLSRIGRFNAVVRAAQSRPRVEWANLAYSFGFADQSHLVREFNRFAGVTPTEYLARRVPSDGNMIVG
jgi:AraC-like DNA-binding protein